jgi:heme/copper-type cytochrome/quinol oxidase subunit 2
MHNNFLDTLRLMVAELKYPEQHRFGFQMPASSTFERLIDLHHFVFFFLIIILITVVWLLINLIDNFIILYNTYNNNLIKNKKLIHQYTYRFFKHMTDFNSSPSLMYANIRLLRRKLLKFIKFTNNAVDTLTLTYESQRIQLNKEVIAVNEHINLYLKFMFSFILIDKGIKNKKFIEDKFLEFGWTLVPCFILAIISIPSFYVLYINEEILNPGLTINIMGHQWYWSFDYTDLFPYWYNLVESNVDIDDFVIDSYMEPEEFLNLKKGSFRLLETEEPLLLPIRLHIRLLISGFDVLHSFAMPSMGLKVDAVPGRLNQLELFIKRAVYFSVNVAKFVG